MNSFEPLIDEQILLLKDYTKNSEKLSIVNNIIELKVLSDSKEHKNDLFFWTKKFINFAILADEEEYNYYYLIDKESILVRIKHHDLATQIQLIEFTIREFKKYGYEKDIIWFENRKTEVEYKLLFDSSRTSSFFSTLYKLSTLNIYTIGATLGFLFILYSTIFLPSVFEPCKLFRVTYSNYSDSFIINHLLNTLLSFIEIQTEFKITALNWMGVLLLSFLKILLFVFIFKFFEKSIENRM